MLFCIYRCVGSSQHLKNKYGDGYQLEIKLTDTGSEDAMSRLMEFVSSELPQSEVIERFSDRILYTLPTSSITTPAHVFRSMELSMLSYNLLAFVFFFLKIRLLHVCRP